MLPGWWVFFNLDMIISVDYRVKSHVATRFRIWTTQRLKEYIIKVFFAGRKPARKD
jgi:hypothetical protein